MRGKSESRSQSLRLPMQVNSFTRNVSSGDRASTGRGGLGVAMGMDSWIWRRNRDAGNSAAMAREKFRNARQIGVRLLIHRHVGAVGKYGQFGIGQCMFH